MMRFALLCSLYCHALCCTTLLGSDPRDCILINKSFKEKSNTKKQRRYRIGDLEIIQVRKGKFCVAYYMSADFRHGMIVYLHRLRASKSGIYFVKKDIDRAISLEEDLKEEWSADDGYDEPDPWCDDFYAVPLPPTANEVPQVESESGLFDDQLQPIPFHS